MRTLNLEREKKV